MLDDTCLVQERGMPIPGLPIPGLPVAGRVVGDLATLAPVEVPGRGEHGDDWSDHEQNRST